ncbi:uncharacterized protein LOC143908235 [Temnothorax americanus]|uniref:uncharacterized protein LOC143908235 n=1 Tax=Temnothorax americanus TaxID=1964332 RepID=UPI0040678D55
MFGRKWGLMPQIMHWMYTAVIRPIITYGALVWWKAMNKEVNKKSLTKVQRLAALGITGVRNNTAQAALEAILNLQPLELYVKGQAAKGAVRLRESNLWKPINYGHSRILEEIGKLNSNKGLNLNSPTDYLVARHNFEGCVNIRIPSKEEWEDNSVINEHETSVYTDASITKTGAGIGIYSEALNIQKSYRLKNGYHAIQAEICAIREAAKLVWVSGKPLRDVTIYSDSQAALRSIASKTVRSKVVMSCQEALSWLRGGKVGLRWVPGHKNVVGNIGADRLAKLGAGGNGAEVIDSLLPPISSLKDAIEEIILEKHKEIWQNRNDCGIARNLWPKINNNRTGQLLKHKKNLVRIAAGVVTGNCAVGVNLQKWKITDDSYCRECNEEEEKIEHLMCWCPALENRRLQTMGQEFLDELEDAAEMVIDNIMSFARNWKCFSARW